MKSVVTISLVIQLSVCVSGNFLAAYRHYFGPGDYRDHRNIPVDQHQQDNRDRQPLWTSPEPSWNSRQEDRAIEAYWNSRQEDRAIEASWNSRHNDRAMEPGYKRSGGGGDKGCAPTTMWVEKTEDRHMPVVMSNKESRDYAVMQYITQTIINTKSIPYFVTQTEVEPEITKKTAILPQRITHTVRTTRIRSITKTEKSFMTVTAQRTQKFFKTVCPKGH